MIVVGGDRKAFGQVLQRSRNRFAAAEIARHAGQIDLGVCYRDLAVLQLADLVEQQHRGRLETRRRAAGQAHLIGDLGPADLLAGGFGQARLHRRQRRGARQRHPHHVTLGAPDEGLGFGNKAGLVIDQPHARDRLDRRHGVAAPLLGEGIRGQADVAAVHRDPGLVQNGVLERGRAAGRQVGLDRQGVIPGRKSPHDGQGNQPWPPFAGPPEKHLHSTTRTLEPETKQTLGGLSNRKWRPFRGPRVDNWNNFFFKGPTLS